MKKVLATTILSAFAFGFMIEPASAILEKKVEQKTAQETILDTVNFDWWKKQNDEHLEKYIVSALNNNYDIKTAALKIEQAQINVLATRAGQMPTVSVGASPAIAKMPETTKTMGSFALPIMASWELDLFGKNWDKTKSSKKLLKGVQYQAAASDIAIVSAVGTVYYNIVKLDKLIEIQEDLVKDREAIYNLMKLSNDEGIVSTSDLIQAEKSFVMAQNELIDFEKTRNSALNALAVLIGDSPENKKDYKRISADELSLEFNIPNEISSDIITSRPDYKSLEHQLEAAGLDVRVAKKEFLPTINILGALAFVATSSASSMSFENALGLLGGSANLPIFTGGLKTANLKLNKNKYEQLLAQYQKTNIVAIQEVNDSLYNFKSNEEKLRNNTKAYNIQKTDYGYSESKYEQGIISKLDLLQHKEALLYMEKLLASSKADCYIDKVGLYKTTGAKI
ncbi:MAG: TolC family protein [Candidatus Gastranaerophilales bacterium]|nr:TolC family protein [Candidatus Gastranaerophilales bacterium]